MNMSEQRLDPTTENILAIVGLLIPILGIIIGLVLLASKPQSAAKIFIFSFSGFALALLMITCSAVTMIGAGV